MKLKYRIKEVKLENRESLFYAEKKSFLFWRSLFPIGKWENCHFLFFERCKEAIEEHIGEQKKETKYHDYKG